MQKQLGVLGMKVSGNIISELSDGVPLLFGVK